MLGNSRAVRSGGNPAVYQCVGDPSGMAIASRSVRGAVPRGRGGELRRGRGFVGGVRPAAPGGGEGQQGGEREQGAAVDHGGLWRNCSPAALVLPAGMPTMERGLVTDCHSMNRTARAAATALALLAAHAAIAQTGAPAVPDPANLRGESSQTRKRLSEAEQKILGGKAADAADDLQRLLDESGDDLITLDGRQYQAARWVAHTLLAKLPPDALRAYQDRIDQPAKKLLDQAKRPRPAPAMATPRPLLRLAPGR